MSIDPIPSAALDFAFEVEGLYSALLRSQGISADADPSLGGKLLYASELSGRGRALLIAGNIAGAASLAATADPVAQKQAIREGVADFLVTSFDEAVRILKNEIRKRETVAVCIAAAPQAIENEMRERGVRPDLAALEHRIPSVNLYKEIADLEQVMWNVAASPAQWLPRIDSLAIECFCRGSNLEAKATERWLRLSPRYLGRLAQGFRVVRGPRDAAQQFVARVRGSIVQGQIDIEVRIHLHEEMILLEPAKLKSSQ